MVNEYDFTQDESPSYYWENMDEKAVKADISALISRINAACVLLDGMVYKNEYDKTEQALSDLWMKDFGAEGLISSFIRENEAISGSVKGSTMPSWFNSADYNRQKAYLNAIQLYKDFSDLAAPVSDLRKLMMLMPLKGGFKFMRLTLNFDEAGYGQELFQQINTDTLEVSRILNQRWDVMERNASRSESFYNSKAGKVSRSEMIQGYRKARIEDYRMEIDSSSIRKSFDFYSDGIVRVKPSMMAKVSVIDKYTLQISTLDNIEDDVKSTIDSVRKVNGQLQALKQIKTQEIISLVDTLYKLNDKIYEFCEGALNVYTCYKNRDNDQPYCFVKILPAFSQITPNYSFQALSADPWKDGSQYVKLYESAAKSLSSHCYDFVYEHGRPELK